MSDRRLIEDSLPLAEISEQSAREKYIRKGHISTLHLWWARRPLAACRAAVYAAMVDAPKTAEERQRQHELLKKIVDWDVLEPSHPDHGLLKVAADDITKAHAARLARRKGKDSGDTHEHPRVLDPFTGGGAIPLEAQRLGCETFGNDLNPVAHVIELGSIYYPQRFAKDTVRPKKDGDLPNVDAPGEPRLAVEVERWANWVQKRVAEEVGSLYPSSGPDREVLGYFWVRQVHCANPACRVLIPAVNQTWLANKANRKIAYRIKSNAKRTGVEYSLHYDDDIDFDPKAGTYGENKLLCPCCGEVTDGKYMRAEGMAGKIEQDLVLVCEVSTKQQGRFYRLATEADRKAWRKAIDFAAKIKPVEGDVSPDRPSGNARGLSAVTRYGMSKFADFFNARQTVTLDAYARAIRATRDEIAKTGEDLTFADAVACYLALALDRIANQCSCLARWDNTPVDSTRALPKGARFYRCAFQVNPAHYSETFRGNGHGMDERTYVQKLLDRCVDLEIEVIAVTDHNHAGSIAIFRDEAKTRGITVFPGFEVASSEGVHVLCLYSPDATDAELQRYLGQLDITTTEPSSSLSKKQFSDLLKCVREQGGLTIAAHITHDKGLLHTLHGQARINAWRDPNLVCVQIPGSIDEAPEDKRPILKNQNADYKRETSPDGTSALAIVNAGDVAKPEDLDQPTSTCWVKMTEPSLEGLRQAFLDPGSRIRLASDPVPEAHAEFVAMEWQGGFLDTRAVWFNENLNVLIGGRGTGKSTVIESLRYVLGLEPIGEDTKKAHEGIVKHVLKSGTRISLHVRVHHPARQDYVIERTVPNAAVVKDNAGQTLPYKPIDVVPRAQVFGQHEISELTKNGEKLTRLLDRFISSDDAAQVNKVEKKQGLAASRDSVVKAASELTKLDEKLAALPKLEETLKRFQEAGLEEKMKDKSLLIREEQLLKQADGVVGGVRQLAADLRAAIPLDTAFVDTITDDLPNAEKLRGLKATLANLQQATEQAASTIETAVSTAETERAAFQSGWNAHRKTVDEAYEKTLRELQKAKIDGEEFVRLKKQIEALRPLREQRLTLEKRLADEREARRTRLVEWENAKAEQFRALERAAKKVTKRLEGRVRVRVSFAAVRDQLLTLLKEKVGGRLSEALETLRTVDPLSLSELATAGRNGKDVLASKYGLLPAQAEKLAQAPETVWMEVEELDLPATTTIELNTAPEGEDAVWQKLEDLSTGQKATAVLLLLLLDSDAPLVVDQPEDDLDNRFITESIVPKMREEKRRRQFVFATHNANIPVLGDAELIIGLSARSGANQSEGALAAKHMGAIDARGVRELVEEVLEGGRRAFELRRLKYGF